MDVSQLFLTAEWRDLILLNYEVDASLLQAFVPAGTELERWQGRVFLSLVGFRFLNTRVFRLPVPFHRNFEEVNLRFYVRRKEGNEVKRGVVFVREIVPRWAIAAVARTLYNENYIALPMAHRIDRGAGFLSAEYSWRVRGAWNRMRASVADEPALPSPGSQEEFIAEHYWGYASQPEGGCVEYRVAHAPWRVWSTQHCSFEGGLEDIYDRTFAAILRGHPASAFIAEGSAVSVYRGKRI
jgi:uncharacterized protein YqjF (DUF2071 family)